MKHRDIHMLCLLPKTLDELPVDVVRAVVSDEFNRPKAGFGDKLGNYRTRAIDRLAASKLPIRSECNIAWDVMRRFVSISCPYCFMKMAVRDGGGSGDTTTQNYACGCGARASLTVDDRGLTFQPSSRRDDLP